MKTVFISRDLGTDSPFREQLEEQGWQVTGQSLICFEAVSFDWPREAVWIFFTSRKGVAFFWDGIGGDLRSLRGYRIACMGKGTAAECFDRGMNPDFIGNGRPEAVAYALAQLVEGSKVLFPIAERSLRSVQSIWKDDVRQEDLIVYRQKPKQKLEPFSASIYVLTSPLNCRILLERKLADRNAIFVAIGNTTAKALAGYGITQIRVAREASEKGLAEAVSTSIQERK
jgi:uroporphyrinogen-III synthase